MKGHFEHINRLGDSESRIDFISSELQRHQSDFIAKTLLSLDFNSILLMGIFYYFGDPFITVYALLGLVLTQWTRYLLRKKSPNARVSFAIAVSAFVLPFFILTVENQGSMIWLASNALVALLLIDSRPSKNIYFLMAFCLIEMTLIQAFDLHSRGK
jgi:hypothetical protein